MVTWKVLILSIVACGAIGTARLVQTARDRCDRSRGDRRRSVSLHARRRAAREGQHRPQREDADRLVEPADRHRDAGRRHRAQRPEARRHDAGAGEGRARAARRDAEPRGLPEGRWRSSTPISCSKTRTAPTRGADAAIRFGRGEYYLAILGKPSATDTVDAAVRRPSPRHQRHASRAAQQVLTPTHTGAQPASYSVEGRRSVRSATRTTRRSRWSTRSTPSSRSRRSSASGTQSRARPRHRRQDDRSRKACARRRSRPPQRAMLLDLVARVGRHSRRRSGSREDEGDRGRTSTRPTSRGPAPRPTARAPTSGSRGRRCSSSTRRRGRATTNGSHPHDLSRSDQRLRREGRTVTPVSGVATTRRCGAADRRAGARLDEYLQAARCRRTRWRRRGNRPDAGGGGRARHHRDPRRDADAAISPEEARAYGQAVMSDVRLTLDGHPVDVRLDRVEVPSAADLRAGLGTIAVRASGSVDRLGAGRHSLQFQNNHHPGGAAYLINALAPDDPAIRVVGQRRDPIQRDGRIEYRDRFVVGSSLVLAVRPRRVLPQTARVPLPEGAGARPRWPAATTSRFLR